MTRRSKREIERAVERLDGGDSDPDPLILFENSETGELRDADGEIVEEQEAAPLMIIVRDHLVETDWEAEES